MDRQSKNDETPLWVRNQPGDPSLTGVNWGGLTTLYVKEVRRFFKVQTQT
ncbi:MAG TPA: multidrug ABC transporter permease, partial [Sphingomicrobium sp.]|nr:multidrug ABC transporter permease [Sphingomicrobium sp.]